MGEVDNKGQEMRRFSERQREGEAAGTWGFYGCGRKLTNADWMLR